MAEGDTSTAPEMGLYRNTNRAGTEYTTKMSVKEAEDLGLERVGDVREGVRKPGPDDPEEAYAGVAPIGGRMHPEEAANVAAVEAERDEAATKEEAAAKRRETANKARTARDKS